MEVEPSIDGSIPSSYGVDIPFVLIGNTDNLVFASGGQPVNVANNAPQPNPVIVDADKPDGSLDTNFNGQVTIGLTPGTGTNPGGGTLSAGPGESVTVTAVNGVAKFYGLTVDQPGSGYTLTATDTTDNLTVASDPFNIGGLIVNTNNDDELSQLPPGELSLRGAIETVDNDPSTYSGTTISFDIPGGGIPEIDVTGGPLPEISTPVIIDGTSQPVTGQVEVDGSASTAPTAWSSPLAARP